MPKTKQQKKQKHVQQKPPSKTDKTIEQLKSDIEVSICESCIYEFGACQGVPVFASGSNIVVKCPVYQGACSDLSINLNISPDAIEYKTEGKDNDSAPDDTGEDEDSNPPGYDADHTAAIKEKARNPDLPDPHRFDQEEDFGKCQSCEQPLKRTAYSRYVDAVRCTNQRCRNYRVITKTVPTGVK